jgi:hypothetical protein
VPSSLSSDLLGSCKRKEEGGRTKREREKKSEKKKRRSFFFFFLSQIKENIYKVNTYAHVDLRFARIPLTALLFNCRLSD